MWWGGGGSDPDPVEEVMYSSLYVLGVLGLGIGVVEKLVLQLFMFTHFWAWAQSHTLKTQARKPLHNINIHFPLRASFMHKSLLLTANPWLSTISNIVILLHFCHDIFCLGRVPHKPDQYWGTESLLRGWPRVQSPWIPVLQLWQQLRESRQRPGGDQGPQEEF